MAGGPPGLTGIHLLDMTLGGPGPSLRSPPSAGAGAEGTTAHREPRAQGKLRLDRVTGRSVATGAAEPDADTENGAESIGCSVTMAPPGGTGADAGKPPLPGGV